MKLSVTGLGLVTSVGDGVVGSCTALHAGMSRPRPLTAFTVEDEPGEEVFVTGHPVFPFAAGFYQTGAWVRLASGAFENLREGAPWPTHTEAAFWQRTGLIALGPLIDEERFGWSLQTQPGALKSAYLAPLVSLLDVPLREQNVRALALGHGALAEALPQAAVLLEKGSVDRVLILSADSYVDAESLAWLARGRRLKSPRRHVGLMPGEAGAAILVERPPATRRNGAPPLVHIEAVARGALPDSGTSLARLGRMLAQAIQQVLPTATQSAPFRGDLFVDLNGEDWRAQVWGHAQVLLASQVDFARCRLRPPAESLGETGAAGASISLAAAAWAFFRGHAAGERALVCCVSDAGQASAVLLARPE